MPWHIRDLRKRTTQPYKGKNPIQVRWTHPKDPTSRVERSFPNRTAAREWASREEHKANHGEWVDPNDGLVTLGEVADEWYQAKSKIWQDGTAYNMANTLD